MKNRIALDLKRSDLTSRIAYAISDAVDEYKGRRFVFNQARSTFNTVDGQEFYTTSVIPDDIAEIDALTITVNGRKAKLDKWSFALMESINTTTTSEGQPSAWAWYAQQIRLYPVPDAVYTLTISYLQRIDMPASDGDSNAWTTEAEQLIRYCAEKIIWRDHLRNPAAAAQAEIAEMTAFRRLKRELLQLDSGALAASGF